MCHCHLPSPLYIVYTVLTTAIYSGFGVIVYPQVCLGIYKGGEQAMKVKRFFTDQKTGPYKDIVWERRKSEIRNPDGKAIFSEDSVVVPSFWSQIATDILAQKYFRKAGIPADKMYEWKKWCPGGLEEVDTLPEDGAEHDARQVFHRLAFTWMDWGRRYM